MIDAKCPICDRRMKGQVLSDWPQFPFCSPKCKTIDLGRWLSDNYHVPAEEPDEATEEADYA